MPRIFTHPDMDFNVNIKKVLIRNANWDSETCQHIINELSDKEYDIYLYHSGIDDVQWEEGVRNKAVITLDADNYKGRDTVEWLKEFDADFSV
jgi:hypothetical protein